MKKKERLRENKETLFAIQPKVHTRKELARILRLSNQILASALVMKAEKERTKERQEDRMKVTKKMGVRRGREI